MWLLVATLAAGAALGAWYWSTRSPPADEDQLVGDWQVTRPGDRPGTASPQRVRITRAADGAYRWAYLTPDGRETSAHRLTVNPAADPKELDLTPLDAAGRPLTFTHGPGKGMEVGQRGVYALDGDTLTVALAPVQEGRRPRAPDPQAVPALTLTRVR